MHKKTRQALPDIAFLYYRNAACVAEIARRTKLSETTVHKVINSGKAREYILVAEHNDANWDPKRQPFRTLFRRNGSTTGRWS